MGGVQVEVQDENRQPLPGCTLAEAIELFGDRIDGPCVWQSTRDLSSLAGQVVRLRWGLRAADVYSCRFSE